MTKKKQPITLRSESVEEDEEEEPLQQEEEDSEEQSENEFLDKLQLEIQEEQKPKTTTRSTNNSASLGMDGGEEVEEDEGDSKSVETQLQKSGKN